MTGVSGLDRDARRALVEGTTSPALNGIDAVEVLSNFPGSPGHQPGVPQQRTLLVRLLRDPANSIDADQVRVIGGARTDPRVNPVRVLWAYPAIDLVGDGTVPPTDPLPDVLPADRSLVAEATEPIERSRVLVVRTSSSGDWSVYSVVLTGTGGAGVPMGFDEPLASAPFRFTVDCPSELDCRTLLECAPPRHDSPLIDYLARDYDALRTRLLDRLSAVVPGWTDRSPADLAVILVELFAALGDRLTLWQDGVAAEAYLGTARRRTSIRRHARLLDYRVHDGCSARTWLAFTTEAAVSVPARSPVSTTYMSGASVTELIDSGAVIFETCTAVDVRPERNALPLHSWGDPEHCLPAGTTSAFVARTPADGDPDLRAGDVLVLAPVGADGTTDTGDVARRHAVRLDRDPVTHNDPLSTHSVVLELHWSATDALTVPLPVAERAEDGSPRIVAAAMANIVLADHGGTVSGPLDPPQVTGARYRPRLPRPGLAFADPTPPTTSSAAITPDPRLATAELEVDDGRRNWRPRQDLLDSGRLDAHVVVESEPGHPERLRFGDGVTGRRPAVGAAMTATYRIGGGAVGNVGADVLTHVITSAANQVTVTNPLPAVGGTDPQPLAEVRALAPHAFRRQRRAVTSTDYAEAAMASPAVQRATARRRWTGSWYAQEVTLDPVAERAADPGVGRAVAAALEVWRMTGVDVEVARPQYVPLEIVVRVCLAGGHDRADVAARLAASFGTGQLPDGSPAFFNPDRFTFGQPLYVSDLVAAVMAVPGVAWVDVGDDDSGLRFRRRGRPAAGEAARGRIGAAAREVLRADSDPSNPENGRISFAVRRQP
ncbi:putative baseplate assembly protein [Mycolicibacterium celeriflavum]|uniref:putative baseplate assembly protein n=1 Tax=Mycolicibacterium celeriflavum TaxID=1249101 RepID=UPI003CFB4228